MTTDYTDGRWVAMSMGQFIQILVDSGGGPEAILFRVMQPDEPVDDDTFIRQYHVIQVPSGSVQIAINGLKCDAVHKVLAGFLERGLVK